MESELPVRFPKRASDGTFSVLVTFQVSPGGAPPGEDLSRWLRAWSERNAKWPGEGGVFADTFLRPPAPVQSAPDDQVWIRLDATADAPYWKDWLVKLVRDIHEAMPDLVFLCVSQPT